MVELMVTVGIVAVLMAVAVPGLSSFQLANRLTSYAGDFGSSIQLARSEAIKRNAAVTLCRSSTGTSCATSGTFQQGWIVFRDVDGNGTVDSADTLIQYQSALSTNYQFTSTAYSLSFQPSGVGSTNATLVLCRSLPTPGEQRRELALSSTSRLTTSRVRSSACP